MKSILHIGKFYPPFNGGIENFMAELLPSTNNNQYEVSALVHQHKLTFCNKHENIDGVAIFRSTCFGSFMFCPISPLFLKDFKKCCKKVKPDIIHIHMPNTSAFWLLMSAEARKVPWVIHWHSDVVGEHPKWFIKLLYPLYRVFEKKLLDNSKKVVCTSINYAKNSNPLKNYLSKIEVIPLGLKKLNVRSMELKPAIRNKKLKILVVGRLSYYKGHQYLFEAIASLTEKQQSEIEVKIVGTGELIEDLGSRLEKHALLNIEMLGKVSPTLLEECYQWCDFLCLPSIEKTEAFGLVILEAARHSKPSMVTDVKGSGMSWIVQNEISGWVVEPKSSKAIAKKLTAILTTSEICHQFGKAAFDRFENDFSINSVTEKTLALYDSIWADS